ncbi:MAG: galactose mutarotase [Planctomycetes bacterium]|nr:galactose mutarotase [Planctomycetota bacterium]
MHAAATLSLFALAACATMNARPFLPSRDFGIAKDGSPTTLWTLRAGGVEVDVTDHGATLVAVRTKDRAGFAADIVLGFDDVAGYESAANQYFGCTTGRVCNRIKHGEFELDGHHYVLAVNNGPNHLHGGATRSLDKVQWQGEVVAATPAAQAVRFTYRSKDGEEGYPGNLDVEVTYTLAANGQLTIDYVARTDRRTPVNLTNHAYWNLAGAGAETVLDHVLWIDAGKYTPVDDTLIPTGAISDVAGTPLDFQKPLPIGLRIDALIGTPTLGYDHNYVLRKGDGLRQVATLQHRQSGRSLAIETTEPGLQFYSGNFLHGQQGKGGRSYALRSALCLETQHYPDSVNQPRFPTTLLAPGQTFRSTTRFTFATE